ncbi:MAG: PadR family transcriptional regulator [Vicinamibacterales bacterium]
MPPASALGEFEVLVLMAVLRLGEGAYGSAVRDELEARTSRRISRGAVYVTLDRLDAKRLLLSRLVDRPPEEGGRPLRLYRVSPAGRKAVTAAVSDVAQMRTGIEALLPLKGAR